MKDTILLAIESSCDDTSVAVLKGNKVLSNIVSSQSLHDAYGGVVPELASREHLKNISLVHSLAMEKASITMQEVQHIAYTAEPGLLGSLLVGKSYAMGLGLMHSVPVIPINHMKAHIAALFIASEVCTPPQFPFLCLLVSGGHTEIVQIHSPGAHKVLGSTQDDAVGEAYDKTARLLGLGYPGGPEIDRIAQKGNPHAFQFTKPKMAGYDFSFSGLKSNVQQFLAKSGKKNPTFISDNLEDICASFQNVAMEILLHKLDKCASELGIRTLALAGGVSANSRLREQLSMLARHKGYQVHFPEMQYCTDNAAMIGMQAMIELDLISD